MANKQGFRSGLVRVLGFVRKELFSVIRQPRLLLTLVVAPFLIVLIFGLGYREDPRPFRTLLVLGSEDADLGDNGEDLSEVFGKGIDFQGTTTDGVAARQRLSQDDIDLLIVAPEEPLQALTAGERAKFQVIHGEVDPVLRASISLLAELSVDKLNRRVLAGVVDVAQQGSEDVETSLSDIQDGASRLVAALESGDRAAATEEIENLRSQISAVEEGNEGPDSLYTSVAAVLGAGTGLGIADLDESLDRAGSQDQDVALAAAREIDASVGQLGEQMSGTQELDPDLLVSPFGVEVTQINNVSSVPGVFYSPGTLVVLLQHLAVTFAALSLVRERQLGLTNVFRASPLSPGEAIAGKYLGFGGISVVVAAALTGAMLLFGVALKGSFLVYTLVVVLLILASLGVGFLLSAVSTTDSQAVQYSMMALLLSIFFTGFVLPLEQLAVPVQVISYLIPATYGIRALHDVVFRGLVPAAPILGGLFLFAVAAGVAAWFVMRRDVKLLR